MKIGKAVATIGVIGAVSAGCSSAEAPTPPPTTEKRITVDFNPNPLRAFQVVDCEINPHGSVSYIDTDPLDVEVFTPRSIGIQDTTGNRMYTIGATLLQLGNLEYELATSNTMPGESTTINLGAGAFSRLIEDEAGAIDGVLTARLQDGAAVFRIDCISEDGASESRGIVGPV